MKEKTNSIGCFISNEVELKWSSRLDCILFYCENQLINILWIIRAYLWFRIDFLYHLAVIFTLTQYYTRCTTYKKNMGKSILNSPKVRNFWSRHLEFLWNFIRWYSTGHMTKVSFWKFKMKDRKIPSLQPYSFFNQFQWLIYRWKDNLAHTPSNLRGLVGEVVQFHILNLRNHFSPLDPHHPRALPHSYVSLQSAPNYLSNGISIFGIRWAMKSRNFALWLPIGSPFWIFKNGVPLCAPRNMTGRNFMEIRDGVCNGRPF